MPLYNSVEIIRHSGDNDNTDPSSVAMQQSLFAELQGNVEGFEPMRGIMIILMLCGYYAVVTRDGKINY